MRTAFNVQELIKKYEESKQKFDAYGDMNITRDDFANIVPWLGFDGENTPAKIEMIKMFPAVVNKKNKITYYKYQTTGKDFINFYFLIDDLKMKFDAAGMIIFTNRLKHDEVKKEALFIWWIMNILMSDPFISSHKEMLYANVQESLDQSISGKYGKKFDLYFPKLRIIVEIDEAHGISTMANDNFKNALAKLNGDVMIRVVTKPLLDCVSYKGRPYTGKDNALIKTKNEIIRLVSGSLMRFEKCRKSRVSFLFAEIIQDDINKLGNRIKEKDHQIDNGSKDSETYKNLIKQRGGLIYNYDKKVNLLGSLDDDIVKNMFDLKRKSENSKKAEISFHKLLELVKFIDKDDIANLYGFIEDRGLFNYGDKFTWKDLSQIFTEYTSEKFIVIKNMLNEYYRNIEIIYETFINDIVYFYGLSISSREYYDMYIDKISEDDKKIIQENNSYKEKILELEKDLEFYDNRKHDMFADKLTYNGKGDYCEIIIDKLKYLKYDFCNSRISDTEFDTDLNNVTDNIKNLINKYEKYYDKDSRSTTSTPYMNLDAFLKRVKENHAQIKLNTERLKAREKEFSNDHDNDSDNSSESGTECSNIADPDDFIVGQEEA